ncbi:MAG: YfhO family protein [Ruminococcus sp.]|nr:YfhO family protein [Ruminococcus sp.]
MQKLSLRHSDIPFWKTGGFMAFTLGFLTLLVTILPIIITEKGYFIYYGDYNAQQIPFNYLASSAVKSGSFGWNWHTDLGSSFIGSYAFYLLGSPFFWLTALLPSSWCVRLMPFVLALKHGVAALTAYAYIKRFTKSQTAAVIGGMLYAFSGFQIFNIFFNHFHDVTALFPLMLISMEELVYNNRKGVFALTTALMAAVNYFFFTGEAVFLVLYFIVRCFSKDFPASAKKFFQILFEAVIGVTLACVILLPAALALLSNYRISEHLYGMDMIAYSDRTRLLRIIQSFFMIPDVPARPNLFSEGLGKWASIGGYLPLFSMTGVIAFLKYRDGHWAKRLVIICMICAFFPILNSAFYMFNSSYYARWFFMPILIMSMMTACVLDEEDYEKLPSKDGLWITAAITGAFGVMALLPEKDSDGQVSFFTITKYPFHFLLVMAVAVLSLAAAGFVFSHRKKGIPYLKTALIMTSAASVVCTASVVYFGANSRENALDYIDMAIDRENDITISADNDDFFRVDISENRDNYPMLWGLPNMRCFHSVVSGSVMEFYADTDIGRDVASRVDTSHYALRSLFSVKYYFDEIDEENTDNTDAPISGFEFLEDQNGFHVYENQFYIPMGFTFDKYISKEDWMELNQSQRINILVRALVLDEEQIEQYGSLMSEISHSETFISKNACFDECQKRAASSAHSFTYDSYGFTAEISTDSDNLVFFSVPFEKGWSAKVNGIDTEIEAVDSGFMAVPVSAGNNTIEFFYETSGLKAGALVSLTGVLILTAYMIGGYLLRKKK